MLSDDNEGGQHDDNKRKVAGGFGMIMKGRAG
jgi:hypothetical protein